MVQLSVSLHKTDHMPVEDLNTSLVWGKVISVQHLDDFLGWETSLITSKLHPVAYMIFATRAFKPKFCFPLRFSL